MLAGAPVIASAAPGGAASPGQTSGTATDPGMNEGQQNQPGGNGTTGSDQSGMSSQGTNQQLSQNMIQGMQQKLQQEGYYKDGQVDGMMGPQTHQALQQFQQAKGLQASGQPDQQTMAALGINAEDNGQGTAHGG